MSTNDIALCWGLALIEKYNKCNQEKDQKLLSYRYTILYVEPSTIFSGQGKIVTCKTGCQPLCDECVKQVEYWNGTVRKHILNFSNQTKLECCEKHNSLYMKDIISDTNILDIMGKMIGQNYWVYQKSYTVLNTVYGITDNLEDLSDSKFHEMYEIVNRHIYIKYYENGLPENLKKRQELALIDFGIE